MRPNHVFNGLARTRLLARARQWARELERHSFVHADSWLDEYKRIYEVFEARLK